MRKLIAFALLFLIFSSCDPVAQMEANIVNRTSQNLTVDFVSSDISLNKTLQMAPGQTVLFQEVFDVGNTFLEPSLVEYDSVLIKDQSETLLKVYKENDSGKNIYNIDDYWTSREPAKRVFEYEYEIGMEDIE